MKGGAAKRCCSLTRSSSAPFLPGQEHDSTHCCSGAGRRGLIANSSYEASSEMPVCVSRLVTCITYGFQ